MQRSSPRSAALDVALIGVPMDLGVTNRAGARLGPRAVRAIERIGPIEHALKIAPMTTLNVADVGDVPFRSRFSLEQCHEDIVAYYTRVLETGVIPLSVGGDHSVTQSILQRARARRGPWAACTSTRTATPAACTRARSSTTAARSARQCSTARSIRSAPSRSASAAAPSTCGSSRSTPA